MIFGEQQDTFWHILGEMAENRPSLILRVKEAKKKQNVVSIFKSQNNKVDIWIS